MFKTCEKHNRTYYTKFGCMECLEARREKTKARIDKPKIKEIQKSLKKRCEICKVVCQGKLCRKCFFKQKTIQNSDNIKNFLKKLKVNDTFTEKPKDKSFQQTIDEMNDGN